MVASLRKKVLAVLQKQKRTPINLRQLARLAGVKKTESDSFFSLIEEMKNSGELFEQKHLLVLSKNLGYQKATIVKIHETFGFAKPEEGEEDVFIPGRALMGAMPGDMVLIKSIRRKGQKQEGEVIAVISRDNQEFTGVLKRKGNKNYVIPDRYVKIPMEIGKAGLMGARDGDKVVAQISRRGTRHASHIAKIVKACGSSQKAASSCDAILQTNHITKEFSEAVLAQAKEIEENGIHPAEYKNRLDLRDSLIFTIDGADTKDIDDAVSLKKGKDGWQLGVHIADVSYYVKYNSPLDMEAYQRGTSVYFADSVIPMLPKELSNGICSLNPQEDRLAFSALMELDHDGNLTDFQFKKTVIRSHVKGVYSEINKILDKTADDAILEKYKGLCDTLTDMMELAELLTKKRFARGGLNLESVESKIILDKDGIAVDIQPRERGQSERIIEEFMLVANQAAATTAMKHEIPFVYRVHESPSENRITTLHDLLATIGIDNRAIQSGVKAADLSGVLKAVHGTPLELVVNNQILRTMAKAKYSSQNLGHYGLVMDNYAHFTSPIRRYPDLIIHRILSSFAANMQQEKITRLYGKYVNEAANHCSQCEVRAMTVERDCEDCYKAEYISGHIGETFPGTVASVVQHGMYIVLENTVEGLVHINNMPSGEYIYDDRSLTLKERYSNKTYRVGDKVTILVAGADISLGQIDFTLAEDA